MPSHDTTNIEVRFKAEQKKFEAFFYGAETAMVIFKGSDMVFEAFNDKYREIYPGRDLINKSIFEVIPELLHSAFPGILKKVYDTGEAYFSHEGLARIFNKRTGELEERYFDTTFSRISYGEDEPYRILATPREVTARVLDKKKLEVSLLELQKEKDLRERFVSALTHDLRTPLAIAKVGSQVIKLNLDKPQTVIETADRIAVSVDRAERMIKDLLDANRLKAGVGINITLQECHLDSIVSFVVDDLEKLHGKRFKFNKANNDIYGKWDNLAIHRMIENLSSNAIKYGSHDTDVILTISSDGEFAEISVHNEGKAISTSDKEKLFTHYNRTSAALESGKAGWGIGLALVKGLAEAHGGSICAFSEEGQGTTFTIRLPLYPKK